MKRYLSEMRRCMLILGSFDKASDESCDLWLYNEFCAPKYTNTVVHRPLWKQCPLDYDIGTKIH